MADTKFIYHKGGQITFIDCAHVDDAKELLRRIDEAREFIGTQPESSVLSLTWVEGTRFNQDIVKATKDMVAANKPYVRSSAVVGLSGLLNVATNSIMQLTGRSFRSFDDLEAAKDWLIEQD